MSWAGPRLRGRAHAALAFAILAGLLAYPALLFFVGPAADARYLFPSNVMALLLAVSSLGPIPVRSRR